MREKSKRATSRRPVNGGQKTNKTLSGVTLLHRPTGIRVRCQRERSQGINRFIARRLLVEELEARAHGKTRHEVKAEHLREEKERRRGSRKKTAPMAAAVQPSSADAELLRSGAGDGGVLFAPADALNPAVGVRK